MVDDRLKIVDSENILREIEHNLEHKGIKHVTIQLETAAHQHDNSILCQLKAETSHHDHQH